MNDKPSVVNRLFRNADGKLVVWQMPNIPLAGWFVCMVLARLVRHGGMHDGLQQLSQCLLFVWAYLEITNGASPFRRTLGALVLAALLVSFFS